MPEQKFKPPEQIPTTTLRRSPRFLQFNQSEQENQVTQNSKSRKIRVPNSCSTPITFSLHNFSIKTKKIEVSKKRETKDIVLKRSKILGNGSRRYTRSDGRADVRNNGKDVDLGKQYVIERRVTRRSKEEVSKKPNETDTVSKRLKILGNGSRRCAGPDDRGDVKKNGEGVDLRKQYVIERRVTRSLTRENRNVSIDVTDYVPKGDCSKRVRVLSDEGKAKLGVNLSLQFECKPEKRIVTSPSRVTFREHVEKGSNDSTECSDKGKVNGLHKQSTRNSDDSEYDAIRGGGDEKEGNGCKRKTLIHETKSRSRIEEEHSTILRWTKEQELALQRAYFTAKPTPHFWKKVARMVPGKSAQECFDRIQSENLTPSQPRMRSRARIKNESPLSLSASKLLNSAETKFKKFRSSKRKGLLAQKTIRKLLEKQQNTDQDYEADLFTVLEPTRSPSTRCFHESTAFATPELSNEGHGFLKKCREKSSSFHEKQLSQLKSSCNTAFLSPPVLKQIKNKALHEKYIDQLHWREARRKAASLKNAKCIKSKNDKNSSHFEQGNVIKAAKDALIFDTQEAINQLQSQQSRKINVDDIDNDCFLSNVDECEDGFL
ncbi:uncharacterized protein LOC111408994 [Olea europaea subsp. europaea]|uniref:Uncharacterized protein LOC111408994 n=1 Tax=Olea europaea subsp. europaea TaxID=158383 RepID=A0A8S0RJY7_OLEEU|nr:uncharacterized protein LOC111408994 [Olea europaea subsp. europaea]